jgi:hypothetical protein
MTEPTPPARKRRTRAEALAARAKSQRAFFGHIRREYGLSEVEYRALFYAQGGACYVCREAKGKTKRLGVDHNHQTGEVRGLLCTGSFDAKTCNRLIAILGRHGLQRGLEQLGYEVTLLTPVGPPARRILVPLRAGETTLPFLYKEGTFELSDVGGVDLDA